MHVEFSTHQTPNRKIIFFLAVKPRSSSAALIRRVTTTRRTQLLINLIPIYDASRKYVQHSVHCFSSNTENMKYNLFAILARDKKWVEWKLFHGSIWRVYSRFFECSMSTQIVSHASLLDFNVYSSIIIYNFLFTAALLAFRRAPSKTINVWKNSHSNFFLIVKRYADKKC